MWYFSIKSWWYNNSCYVDLKWITGLMIVSVLVLPSCPLFILRRIPVTTSNSSPSPSPALTSVPSAGRRALQPTSGTQWAVGSISPSMSFSLHQAALSQVKNLRLLMKYGNSLVTTGTKELEGKFTGRHFLSPAWGQVLYLSLIPKLTDWRWRLKMEQSIIIWEFIYLLFFEVFVLF